MSNIIKLDTRKHPLDYNKTESMIINDCCELISEALHDFLSVKPENMRLDKMSFLIAVLARFAAHELMHNFHDDCPDELYCNETSLVLVETFKDEFIDCVNYIDKILYNKRKGEEKE